MTIQKIVLIGFMGSGKTLVAPKIAEALGWQVVDMDAEIVEKSPYNTINEIFEHEGEMGFRSCEAECAQDLAESSEVVIATGGGVVTLPENIHYLKQNGLVVWLETALETVKARIGQDSERPLLKLHPDLEKLYADRQRLYTQYADCRIKTDGKTPLNVTQEILNAIQKEPALGR